MNSFLSSFGKIRETRLTATLAYLISRFPGNFLPEFFSDRGMDYEILIEETDKGDRYDVLLKNGSFPIILEGKIGHYQNPNQLLRYLQNVREKYGRRPELIIVDEGSEASQADSDAMAALKKHTKKITYVSWTKVFGICEKIVKSKKSFFQDRIGAAIAEDLLNHLKENHMINTHRPEIYLRDMSSPESVELYFRYNIYCCQPQFLKSARDNLYFAPYFTAASRKTLVEITLAPVGEGVSYISKINKVQVVSRSSFYSFLVQNKIPNAKAATKLILKNQKRGESLIALLGDPQLLFLSPVTKEKLSKVAASSKFTKGAMGSRSCTFEDLLKASRA